MRVWAHAHPPPRSLVLPPIYLCDMRVCWRGMLAGGRGASQRIGVQFAVKQIKEEVDELFRCHAKVSAAEFNEEAR